MLSGQSRDPPGALSLPPLYRVLPKLPDSLSSTLLREKVGMSEHDMAGQWGNEKGRGMPLIYHPDPLSKEQVQVRGPDVENVF